MAPRKISLEEGAAMGLKPPPQAPRKISLEEGARMGLKPPPQQSKLERAAEGVGDTLGLGANAMLMGLGPVIWATRDTVNTALTPDFLEDRDHRLFEEAEAKRAAGDKNAFAMQPGPRPNEGESLVDFFRRRYQEGGQKIDAARARSPVGSVVGEIGGTALGTGLLGRLLGLAGAGAKTKGLLGVGQRMAGAAAQGGAYGAGRAGAENLDKPADEMLSEMGEEGLINAALSSGGQLVGEAVSGVSKLARGQLAKMFRKANAAAIGEHAEQVGKAGKEAQEAVGGHFNLKDMRRSPGSPPTMVNPADPVPRGTATAVARGPRRLEMPSSPAAPYPKARPDARYSPSEAAELEARRVANAEGAIRKFFDDPTKVEPMGDLIAKNLGRVEAEAAGAAKGAAARLAGGAALGAFGLDKIPGVSPAVAMVLGIGAGGHLKSLGTMLKHPAALKLAAKLKPWEPVIHSFAAKGGTGLGELINILAEKDPELGALIGELDGYLLENTAMTEE